MARRSENRGFASMDPERRRQIASEGGRASHGGRGRNYEDDYEDDYDEDDEDENQGVSNRYEDDEDWDDDDYEDTGYEDDDDYDDEYDEEDDEEEDDRGRGRRSSNRGGRSSSGRGGNTSRRGFASMDPEQQRRIARMGGEATARTHGRVFY
jgi:general stress protein YciG